MVALKINNTLELLQKLQNRLPRSVLITIYEIFERSHLDYGDIDYDLIICPFTQSWNLFSIVPSWP